MRDFLKKIVEQSYFISLIVFVIAFPLSKALLSISLGLIVFSWLVSPGLKNRIALLKSRKSIWVFMLIFFITAAGLIYSDNIARNLYLLFNIKIAIIILPIIIGSSRILSKKELRLLLIFFTMANIIATVISTLVFFQVIKHEITDVRDISIFIESIRFALLIVLNIAILIYAYFKTNDKKYKALIIGSVIWLLYYLNILQALTGIVVLLVLLFIVTIVYWKRIQLFYRIFLVAFVALISISGILFTKSVFKEYKTIHVVDLNHLDSLTINGNPYTHITSDTTKVNGHLVYIYICEPELRKEWAKVSNKSMDSLDSRKWQPIKYTLFSYMSSKGLRKDSLGFSELSSRDIKFIEFGFSNAALADVGLKARIYDVIREFDYWVKTGLPGGSITIRLNAIVNGWKVYKQHPWIGTGYGDINDDIQKQFEIDNKVKGNLMRQNPHNQFFTVLIGSGVIGFIVFLFALIMPGIIEKKYSSYLFLVSFCVVVLSFLSDDTLERMIGCVITAFFFSIFLYAVQEE